MNLESLNNAYSIVLEKLNGWMEVLISMLPNIAIAILVFGAFILLSRLAGRLFLKASVNFISNEALRSLAKKVVVFVVMSLGFFIALNFLHLQQTVTSFLAGAGIIGLALGFAFQDSAANFISGLFMAFRKPFQVDDIVESQGTMGVVKQIDFRTTTLTTFQGQDVIIPNRKIFEDNITNYVKNGERRIDLEVGVSYGDDLDKVETVAKKAVAGIDGVDSDRVTLFYTEFGGSSINFVLQMWIEYPGQPTYLQVRSSAIKNLKVAFDNESISIPFPIRTLDFGIKGGQPMNEVLPSGVFENNEEFSNN